MAARVAKKKAKKKKARISFLDCPHKRVQQFTEICLDCGENRYTSREEYLARLRREQAARDEEREIRRLERRARA